MDIQFRWHAKQVDDAGEKKKLEAAIRADFERKVDGNDANVAYFDVYDNGPLRIQWHARAQDGASMESGSLGTIFPYEGN